MSKLSKQGLEHYHDLIKDGLYEYIEGTQSSATSTWTGVSTQPSLFVGKLIIYHLPYAGGSTVPTLNLTLPGNTTTGAKTVGTRVGTSYSAGSNIILVYTGTAWDIVEADGSHLSGATAEEIGYLSGLTGNVQTQLNAKQGASVSNATAERLGGNPGMTVDEAINATVDESGFTIGNRMLGYTGITDDWIICDGRVVEKNEYPVLWEKLPCSASTLIETLPNGSGTMSDTGDTIGSSKLFEVNGFIVCFQKADLYYRRKNETTWNHTSWDGIRSHHQVYQNNWCFIGIVYDNTINKYCVMISMAYSNSSGYYKNVLYTVSNLSEAPSNNYTTVSGGGLSDGYHFFKVGDYYVFLTMYSYNATAYYTNNILGSWTLLGGTSLVDVETFDDRLIAYGYTTTTESSSTVYLPTVWISERNPSDISLGSLHKFTSENGKYSNSNGTVACVAYFENSKILITENGRAGGTGGMVFDLTNNVPQQLEDHPYTKLLTDDKYNKTYRKYCGKTINGYMYTYTQVIPDNGLDFNLATSVRHSFSLFTSETKFFYRYMLDDGTYKLGSNIYKLNVKTLPSTTAADNFCMIERIKAGGSPNL